MKALRFLWMLSVAALIVQVVYGYTDLPERVASHFDGSGRADGWSSRDAFIATWYGVIVLVNIWPLVIGPLMRKLPPGLLSLPNKEYWLADDISSRTGDRHHAVDACRDYVRHQPAAPDGV